MIFELFWSENGHRFYPLWSEIEYKFSMELQNGTNIFFFSALSA